MDTAQMAQAASALQQSGLAPYLLQQQYNAQIVQLQQVCTPLSHPWLAFLAFATLAFHVLRCGFAPPIYLAVITGL